MLGSNLSRLKIVTVGEPPQIGRIELYKRAIALGLGNVLRKLEVVPYDFPPLERIEASLLTGALAQDVGGHILAITDADLFEDECADFSSFMFGGKDTRNDVAVVSTRRLAGHSRERARERLIKVALHELGHNFGLGHHYSFEPALGGGYCPMSKGDFNGYGERGYVRGVIDARGTTFCQSCSEALQRVAKLFRRGD